MTDHLHLPPPCQPPHRAPGRRTAQRRARSLAVVMATMIAGAAVTLATFVSTPAIANQVDNRAGSTTSREPIVVSTTVTDRDDTDGRLDIAEVRHRITAMSRRNVTVEYDVTTQRAFRVSRLQARWRNFVIELDQDGQSGAERNIRIAMRGGRLVADLISNATREPIARLQVTRLDGHSLRVTGSREQIGARAYFWVSTFHDDASLRCGRGAGFPIVCQDVVPDDGWLRMDRWAWPREFIG